jgi:uncharacterized protein YcbK (DUF882 family)
VPFIKTFEKFDFKDLYKNTDIENMYQLIGTNIKNLIDYQKEELSKLSGIINSNSLNEINQKGKELSSEEVIQIIEKEHQSRDIRLKKLSSKEKTPINTYSDELRGYIQFMLNMFVTLNIDLEKIYKEDADEILGIDEDSTMYDIFDLTKITDFEKNINEYVNKFLRKYGDNNKICNAKIKKFTNQYDQNFINFFESDWKIYQVDKIPETKPDAQQLENEEAINSKEPVEKEEPVIQPKEKTKPTELKKLEKLPLAEYIPPQGVSLVKDKTGNIITDVDQKIRAMFAEKEKEKQVQKIKSKGVESAIKKPDMSLYQRFAQRKDPGKGKNDMKPWFVEMFNNFEKILGKPVYITSGYRSKEYQEHLRNNTKYKAAKNSPHVQGVAVDISTNGHKTSELVNALKKAGFNRIGVGKSFIHADAGDRINPKVWVPFAQWGYNY